LPFFCTAEELFTALLFATSAVFLVVLIPLSAEALVLNLVDAFVVTLREISVDFAADLLSIFLLVETAVGLREVTLPWFTGELETVLLFTLVAEAFSTPDRLLSIDLFVADLELILLRSIEVLFCVLSLRPEFDLA
jgi:hypothetical protein